MSNHESIFKPFSISIYAKIKYMNSNQILEFENARFLESISDDIKKCTNFIKAKASKKAINKSIELNICLNEMNWHNQNKFDKARSIFHFEHLIPVSNIRKLCLGANSEEEILQILISKPIVIWILKEEDRKLTKLGYRSKRDNPEQAYKEAKIEIIENY